jgi:hypothetical protein
MRKYGNSVSVYLAALFLCREMLERMMAMAEVIRNLSAENERLRLQKQEAAR